MATYQFPTILAGMSLTAALATQMERIMVVKPSDTDRASTTTLTDDPDLTVPVVANGVYFVEFGILYGGPTAADFKTAWSTPAGSSGLKAVLGPGSASGDDANANNITGRFGVHGLTTAIVYNCSRNGTGSIQGALENAVITVGGSAGNVTLQWAQNSSNVTADRVAGKSWARAIQLA